MMSGSYLVLMARAEPLSHPTVRLPTLSVIRENLYQCTGSWRFRPFCSSSQAAVVGFSNSLRAEVAGGGLKCCLVIPPAMDTDLVRNGIHVSEEKKEREIRFMSKNAMPLPEVAHRTVEAIQKGRYRIRIGHRIYLLDLMYRLFPRLTHRLVLRKIKGFDFV